MVSARVILRVSIPLTILGILAIFALNSQAEFLKREFVPRRFSFKIDDAMPMHELLPTPPRTALKPPPLLNEDLTLVPEVLFGEPIVKAEDTEEKTAHIVAKINRMNEEKRDGFLKELLAHRPDLRGMPFLMGDDCRTDENQARLFAETVTMVQRALVALNPRSGDIQTDKEDKQTHKERADDFWKIMNDPKAREFLVEVDVPDRSKQTRYRSKASKDDLERATVAALMQMLTANSAPYRAGLVKHLTTLKHADAARALAKLALFTPEDPIRAAAVEGLKARNAKDYNDVLLGGFRYPLPVVSKRAAEALVKTQNKDALDDLVNVLEQADPRAPVKQKIDGKEVTFVREMVRVNHHHNCLMCHAPATSDSVPTDVLTAPVPLPDRTLPSPFEGYGRSASPDIFVRIDMTYLRQDFSLMMDVANAKPWPEKQRFDFFVRTRELTAQETADCEKQLGKQTPPNHVAAQYALRELVGRTEETPQAWRRAIAAMKKQGE